MTGAGNASMPSGDMPRLEPSEGWVGMGVVLPFLPESWFSGTTTISLKTLDVLSLNVQSFAKLKETNLGDEIQPFFH